MKRQTESERAKLKQKVRDLDQEVVNECHLSRAEIAAWAERSVNRDRYPQYDGHFDHWAEVCLTQKVTTKAGTAFLRGDITLGIRRIGIHGEEVVVYSFRNGMDTVLRTPGVVEFIGD